MLHWTQSRRAASKPGRFINSGLILPHSRHHVSETGKWCTRSRSPDALSRLTSGLQEIQTWVTALGHYDNNEFDEALKDFDGIADTSKILFNMGVIHATLGEHERAVSMQAAGPRSVH